jgi:hypothetical protein
MTPEDFEFPDIDYSEAAGLTTLSDEEFSDVLALRVEPPQPAYNSPLTEFESPQLEAADAFREASDSPISFVNYLSLLGQEGPATSRPFAASPMPSEFLASPPDPLLTETELQSYFFAAASRYTYRLDCLTPIGFASPLSAVPRYTELSRSRRNQVFQFLTARSDVVTDSRGRARWMLKDAERRAALTTLVRAGLAHTAVALAREDALLEEPPSPLESPLASPPAETPTGIEETLWNAMVGISQGLNAQSRRQLLLTQRVSSWLHDVATAVPQPQDVARVLARETLLQPFRHLCGYWENTSFISTFRGREEERARINDYLGVLPPNSRWNFLKRNVSRLADSAWQMVSASTGSKPLFMHGPGGTGKSTLLAKVLLDHLTAPESETRFPYAYLDFDVSALNASEPLTLLAEAARQLAVQYASSEAEWTAARETWLDLIRRPDSLNANVRAGAISQFAQLLRDSKTGSGEARTSSAFVSLSLSNVRDVLVSDLFNRGLPFLLVLDTFEEVQYYDRYLVKDVVRFLNELRRHIPNLKAILMGRAPLDDLKSEFNTTEAVEIEGDAFGTGIATDFNVIEVALGEFDTMDAISYLTSQGVQDQTFAKELVEVIGGSPLSLRIVARMLKDERIDIQELRNELEPISSSWITGFFGKKKAAPKAVVQGVLFRRFLNHIHEEKIKSLAHPGLVLRRIDPELIREVLAAPCGLGDITPAQSVQFFWSLAREVSLVGTDYAVTGPVLVHRPDLRRVMLRLMQSDASMADKIRCIHTGSVEYYTRYVEAHPGDLPARVERLYHRLMLEAEEEDIVAPDDLATEEAILAGHAVRPLPADDDRPVWNALLKDVDELPPSGVAYLAARVHREIFPDNEWPLAHQSDLELLILGRCTRQVRSRGTTLTALLSLEQATRRFSSLSSPPGGVDPASALNIVQLVLHARLGQLKEVVQLARTQLASLETFRSSSLHQRRRGETHLVAATASFAMHQPREAVEHLRNAGSIAAGLMASPGNERARGQRLARQLLRFAARMCSPGPSYEVATFLATFLAELFESQSQIDLVRRPALRAAIANALLNESNGPHTVEIFLPLLDRIPEKLASSSATLLILTTLQLPLLHEPFHRIFHERHEASAESTWSQLSALGLPQFVLRFFANAVPAGTADFQSEAASFGESQPNPQVA